MKRVLVLLLAAVVAAFALTGITSPTAQAAATITGKLYDATTNQPVTAGVTVRLRAAGDGSAGAVVSTTTTDTNGAFSLDAPAGERYYVQVVTGRYQGGLVGQSPKYVQPDISYADVYASGTDLGKVRANPAFIRGTVVDAATKKPVKGAKVTARSFDDPSQVEAQDTTDRAGRFVLTGITFEDDGYLKINGSSIGYETGYVACGYGVVPTFGDACASPLGVVTQPIRLDAAAGRIAAEALATRLLKPGRVGEGRAGMTVDEAVATGEFDKNVPNPPCGTIRLQPKGSWKDQYSVWTAKGRINQLNVNGKRVRTPADRGVGSTLGELRSTYGDDLSKPIEAGYQQWAVFVHSPKVGAKRTWIGFLLGNAFTYDGKPASLEKVTFLAATRGHRPELAVDGC